MQTLHRAAASKPVIAATRRWWRSWARNGDLGRAIRRNAIERAGASPRPRTDRRDRADCERWRNGALRMETLEPRGRYGRCTVRWVSAKSATSSPEPRRGALRRLRPAPRAHPHPDDHGRGNPLRLPLSMEKRRGRLNAGETQSTTRRGRTKIRHEPCRHGTVPAPAGTSSAPPSAPEADAIAPGAARLYDCGRATPSSNEEGFQCPLTRQSGNASTASWARIASCSS